MIRLEVSAPRLEVMVARMGADKGTVRQVMRSALGKMSSWARTRSAKGLSPELALQQKVIRRRLRTRKPKATNDGARAGVWYGLAPVSLIHLGARQTKAGVRAQRGRFVRSGFITRGRRGGEQVFKRRGRARLPIERQREQIALPAKKFVRGMVKEREFEARFLKIFKHELTWRMCKR